MSTGYCFDCQFNGQWVIELERKDGSIVTLCSYHEQIERELEAIA
mgnify:CR=1 FL=1